MEHWGTKILKGVKGTRSQGEAERLTREGGGDMLSASQMGLLQEEERGGQVLHAGWISSVSTAVNRLPCHML